MTQKEIVKMALEKLGGYGHLTDIGVLAKHYIGDSSKAKDVRNNVRRELNSNPDLFCHVEGKPDGWWQLKTHKEEIDKLKAIIAEQNKVIEEQKKVSTEDDFIQKLLEKLKTVWKDEKKTINEIRKMLDALGRSDAVAELDSYLESKNKKPNKQSGKSSGKIVVNGTYYAGDNVTEKTVIPSIGNYKPQITTQNIETPTPPLGQQQEQKLLEDE